ncbi:MAG: sigma-54-dependent Fis family transcriptional regulator [Planctomycetes bacterium]|nr:sigma-54-dependent Fis family transcriptional regulator [Planctomycetota bacterium]
MNSKQLKYQLNKIRALTIKRDWNEVIAQCESAVNKTLYGSKLKEEYYLHIYIGDAYFAKKEYSSSIDAYYKAYTVALKHHLKPVQFAYLSAKLGLNLLAIRNIDQAMHQLLQVEHYYQQYGDSVLPMEKSNRMTMQICMAYCYLYRNELGKVHEILEKDMLNCRNIGPDSMLALDCNHLRGEYFAAVKDHKTAKTCFNECVRISGKIGVREEAIEAKVHLASIDMLENNLKSAEKILEGLCRDAEKLKINYLICESALLLSKCYAMEHKYEKAEKIEHKIKHILNSLDVIWLYEKSREFEQLFSQLHVPHAQIQHSEVNVLDVLSDSINRHYENSFFREIVIGKSEKMHNVCQLLEKIAPTDMPILIQGETGTGKELSARAIHQNSTRSKNTWLAFNCGAIQESLLESELFGHEKGAFTGAFSEKRGYIEIASDGTIFLDEIADMSHGLQKKLLRVLEEKQVWRVGAEKPLPVNTRFIFASNQNIEELVRKKLFREDLFYRINTIVVNLPALRERKEDIPWLAAHFLKKCDAGGENKIIVPEAGSLLVNYPWPGNIRELENEIKKICVLYKDAKRVEPYMFSETIKNYLPRSGKEDIKGDLTLKQMRDEFEKKIIAEVLIKYDNNIIQAAQRLGCDRSGLYKKIKQYGLDAEGNSE